MKVNGKALGRFVSVMAAGLMAVSVGHAATIPAGITTFSKVVTSDVFEVKDKGWSDPAFGDMGWTHSSDWGLFTAEKGQTVTIKMVADDKGIHPGSTVWYRGEDDTADDSYVVDHFYPQNANFAKFGATKEDTGDKLGNIIMKYVTHGYDQDKNTVTNAALKGKKDNVSGKLSLSFKAPYSGTYMFVVGGFNPDANITDHKAVYKVKVDLTVK